MISLHVERDIGEDVMGDSTQKKQGISAVQAAMKLGIKAVTLRKYSLIVEKELNDKLKFRNKINKNRVYTASDITRFSRSITLTKSGFALSDALKISFNPGFGEKNDQQRILHLEDQIRQLTDRIIKLENIENSRTQHWWKR